MDNENALKPCPFCRAGGEYRLIELWDAFDAGHASHIHCTNCGAAGPSVYSEIGAIKTVELARSAWNDRTQLAQALKNAA